jgi:hypothetical protein
MKRSGVMMLVAVVVMGMVSAASAAVWVDRDPWNVKLIAGGQPSYLENDFNITTLDGNFAGDVAGFTPGADIVTRATVTIRAKDDAKWDSEEEMKVKLDDVTIGSHIEVDLPFTNFTYPVSAYLIGDINADGILTYKVKATEGDFILVYAQLVAEGVEGSGGAVPEPATLIVWSLLGAGSWLGLRVWRRRGGESVEEIGAAAVRRPWPSENRQAIHDIISRGISR